MPNGADVFLFKLAPYLAFAPVFCAFLALPFAPQFVFETSLNIGVLYLMAVLAVEVMGTILAGWGSNSKWSVFGAMREACQMVSYEIPLGMAILCGVVTAGTLDLMELSFLQAGGIHEWFVFHNPWMFLAFGIYFVASLASNKRAPFDLPESESELVAGFHTEYSGMRFSFFFFAEYAAMFVIGGIQATLFLGGWNSPLGTFDPIYAALGYNPVAAGMAWFDGTLPAAQGAGAIADAMGMSVPALIMLNLYGAFWFFAKAGTTVFLQIWLRWTLPRIRIDQVLYSCVKVLLPASLIVFVLNAVWIAFWPQPAAVQVGERTIARLGHLVSPTPMLQLVVQVLLTLVGVGIVLFFLSAVASAWIHRDKSPRKSFFQDHMPVGNQIAFNPGDLESKAAAAAEAKPA
jgi:NADH-quinone oxidoreductase subunit H